MRPKTRVSLERIKADLVQAAEELCRRTIPQGLSRGEDGVTRAMVQNLLNAANATAVPAELKNFLRYQIGRSEPGKRWRQGNFGPALLTGIQRAAAVVGSEPELGMEAVRHFCGYVLREATYLQAYPAGRGETGAGQA